MSEFNFGKPAKSGTYVDANGVKWTVYAESATDFLAGEFTASAPASSLYGVVTIWGPAKTLKQRIDAYAAGYAVVPPGGVTPESGGGGWLLLLLAAVVLLDEDRRR